MYRRQIPALSCEVIARLERHGVLIVRAGRREELELDVGALLVETANDLDCPHPPPQPDHLELSAKILEVIATSPNGKLHLHDHWSVRAAIDLVVQAHWTHLWK